MSQRAVEAVLGRLITDVEFRRRFFAEPVVVCREDDILLTARETTALLQVSVQALNGLTARLDPKIVRAAVGPHVRGHDGGKFNEVRADRAREKPAPVLRREELDRRGER
jgi:hypothetical protein